jgi:hypothetical protein
MNDQVPSSWRVYSTSAETVPLLRCIESMLPMWPCSKSRNWG